MGISNELQPSVFVSSPEICVVPSLSSLIQPFVFVSSPEICVVPSLSPLIQLKSETSPDIRLVVHKPGKTLIRRKPNTVTVLALPKDTERDIAGWLLKSVLLVQIRRTAKEFVATTWLEAIAEYGVGKAESEAITDLVVSLGEYRQSLEKREANLGDLARRELDYLRRLIEPLPGNLT